MRRGGTIPKRQKLGARVRTSTRDRGRRISSWRSLSHKGNSKKTKQVKMREYIKMKTQEDNCPGSPPGYQESSSTPTKIHRGKQETSRAGVWDSWGWDSFLLPYG